MAGIIDGYNAGWGLLDTPAGKALADEYEKQNDPRYQDKQWIQDYIDSQMPESSTLQPQAMASPDFSNAPAWWNKGGEQQAPAAPAAPMIPLAPTQTPQQAPGRMIDYIGNVGGRTGVVATSPLASALRGVTGGQSNGQ